MASNNVAEYRGLIAGLEMAREIDPDAPVEVRMDSKLVIEQMAGRWKIKHPNMRPLALEANGLRPRQATWTWVPRGAEQAAPTPWSTGPWTATRCTAGSSNRGRTTVGNH